MVFNYKDLLGITEGWNTESKGIDLKKELQESKWLFSLCRNTLDMNEDNYEVGLVPHAHGEYCALLESAVGDCFFRGNKQTLVHAEMPRNTFKTSIACEGLIIGVLLRNPDVRILIANADHKSSQKRILGVKYHLTRNPKFAEEYGEDWKPDFREAPWSSTNLTVSRRKNGALREASVETSSVGIDSTGSRYDLIICDDLVNDKNTVTVELRDKVYKYMLGLLMQLTPGGTLIVIGTRWHIDDAYGRIIREDERITKEGKEQSFKYYIKSCWDGPQNLFFPEVLSREFLDKQRHLQGPRIFAANYENKPVADEDRVFDINNVNVMDFSLFKISRSNIIRLPTGEQYLVNITIAWDPAGRNPTRKSDFHGITVVGTDFADRWWVLVASGWKDSVSGILERMCSHIFFYNPTKIIIEDVGGYGLWIPMLQQKLREKGLSVSIEEDKVGGQNKSTRIQMLEPRVRSGRLYILPEQKALIEQIDNFSAANQLIHEDILDSLAKHEGRTQTARQRLPDAVNIFELDKDTDDWDDSKSKSQGSTAGFFGMKWQKQ